ncbi:type II and III secretion system protein family protein [Hyphomonas sp.]|uniref:type II and III secretion system protein family protein n=1 Tax=Hyphomonas sp. TaxID=87 RepID=UPI000C6663CD|nr:type II and III secretion system protein family protein [Hyphomonas sp.]MAB12096.1 pilus assembly protein CpaC [Hyphomonas sp.]MAU67362.1 pilus assembly protein CpaC [Hyphomonas sp.]
MKAFLTTRLTALLVLPLLAVPAAIAAPSGLDTQITQPGESAFSKQVTLGLNKSTIVDLGAPAADVVITNPEIADAVVQTSQRIIFRGMKYGQTNAFVFDRSGNQILNLEINVEMDMTSIEDMISRHVPGARVKVEGLNGNVVITGTTDSLSEADAVQRLVEAYLNANDQTKIVNMIDIAAKDQVMLEVRIVEMQRSVIKQLGINLSGATNFGDLASQSLQQVFQNGFPLFFEEDTTRVLADGTIQVIPGAGYNTTNQGTAVQQVQPDLPFSRSVGFSSANGYNVAGNRLGGLSGDVGYTNYNDGRFQSSAGAAIDALERIGIVRTLAEPNISAVSGESAKFLAGGEFPVPVGQDNNGRITIEFKPYGVGLGFTPVVLSEGRISLKVSTEVSELTNQGSFQGQSVAGVDDKGNVITAQTLTIPALSVRRAESTVELPSGGSMMLAGLIQTRTRQSLDQLPGLNKLPILGALFQSRDFLNEETELVVIITPYLVDPTQKNMLRTPADGFANASDAKTIFFGKLNEQYGRDGAPVSASDYRAPVGFIEE